MTVLFLCTWQPWLQAPGWIHTTDPFYSGHGTKPTVETDCVLLHVEQTLKDTMAPVMAGCRQNPPPGAKAAVLLAGYADETDPAASPLEES